MLPDLCFAPYDAGDLALSEPLCAPATWRVQTRDGKGGDFYLVRVVALRIGWCELVARHQFAPDAPLLRLDVLQQDASEETILKDIRLGRFERRLCFGDDARLARAPDAWHALLRINGAGETFWALDDELENEVCRFVWSGVDLQHRFDLEWRLRTPDAQIAGEIGEMLADNASDCAFAWTWLHLSARQREQMTFVVARGSLDEIEPLLRAVCQLETGENQDGAWQLNVNIGIGAATEFYADGATEIARRSYLIGAEQSHALSPRQTRLLEIVVAHFELWRNWRAQKYTLVQELYLAGKCGWQISFGAPSMHERLEARLLLRAWLQGKVSSTEARQLLE